MYHDYFLILVLSRLSLYDGLRLYILLVGIAIEDQHFGTRPALPQMGWLLSDPWSKWSGSGYGYNV